MKKVFIYICLIISIFMFTGCGNNKGYEEISYAKLKEKVENNETFALFIGRETCSACNMLKAVLKDVYAKEYGDQATIYYIDLDKLSDDEYAECNSMYPSSTTPTMIVLVEGKYYTYNKAEGYDEYESFISNMKDNNLIK